MIAAGAATAGAISALLAWLCWPWWQHSRERAAAEILPDEASLSESLGEIWRAVSGWWDSGGDDRQVQAAAESLIQQYEAGRPLLVGIMRTAERLADPLGQTLQRVVDRFGAGVPLQRCLADAAADRRGLERLLFLTLRLTHETGHSPAEVLDGFARVARDRESLRHLRDAETAQARWSAVILALMPPVLVLYFWLAAPDILRPMLATRLGRVAAVYAAVSWVIGALLTLYILHSLRW